MRVGIFIFIAFQVLLSSQSFAQTSKSAVASQNILKSFTATLSGKGFEALDQSSIELSKLVQADQVWYDKDSKRHVVGLLADKIENWPRNEIRKMDAGYGYVFKHSSGQDVGLGFYGDFTETEIEDIIVALKKGPTAAQTEAAEAQSRDQCHCSLKQSTAIPFDLTSSEIFGDAPAKGLGGSAGTLPSQAFSCLKDVVQGVWNSTGGQVVDGINVIRDPKKAWDEAHTVFAGVREFVGEFEKNMRQTFSNLSLLDREMIGGILCSMIGEIGGPALVSMLTGGVGLASALNRIRGMVKNIAQVSGLLSLVGKVGTVAQQRERFMTLLQKLLKTNKSIPANIKEDVSAFSGMKMPELAMDSLECAL